MSQFKPMLSATIEDTASIPYPCLVSAKLDGLRCLVIDGVAMTRSLKPFRNKHVQALFGKSQLNGLDGELIVGEPTDPAVYRNSNSGTMSEDGEPDVRFFVFDRWDMPDATFQQRYDAINIAPSDPHLVKVEQRVAATEAELLAIEDAYLRDGYEGVMCRLHGKPYKHGRSTLKEFGLAKLKRFADDDYKVVGFVERMHNANEAKVNALGHTERSMHRENMVPMGTLGALVLEHPNGEFTCGTGFTDADRDHIWANRDMYFGRLATIKSFLIGVKELPRFPVWKSFREDI